MRKRLRILRDLGVIRDLNDLQRAFRELAERVDVSRNVLDEIAGLPIGYSAKVLAQPPVKELGKISQWALLGALGAAFVLVEDKQRLVRIENTQKRIAKHASASQWRNAKALGIMLEMAKQHGSKGGRARWDGMSEGERSQHQRRAANARWRAHRRKLREQATSEPISHKAGSALRATKARRDPGRHSGRTSVPT